MNNDYSIIVPCYKGLQFLPNVFSQINKQTLKPFEIIFINDGDLSLNKDIVIKHNILNLNLKNLENSQNIGVNKSIKFAAKYIKTKFFKIMSVDDIFDKNYAKTHLDMLAKHPKAGMTFSNPAFFMLDDKQYFSYDINLSSKELFFTSENFKKLIKIKL